MNKRSVSMAVVRRLPRYYHYIREMSEAGIDRVSSHALAEKMGLTASQIRQDLNCFGGFGQQGYGYNIMNLKQELAAILGLDQGRRAVIIGAGNMGRALMNNFNFQECGVTLIAAFDTDPSLIGTRVNGVAVKNIDELDTFQKQFRPDVAILTVPKKFVQKLAERVCRNGIKGIWNFTMADLQLEGINVPVENVRFSDSLMILSYKL
ncbi:MAG: redox-sensing transcriptional repressor Rex [Bacillota bacterium]|nr:redox-sensing transcriptional repressor Rex [Bacillota bacterium]